MAEIFNDFSDLFVSDLITVSEAASRLGISEDLLVILIENNVHSEFGYKFRLIRQDMWIWKLS